MNAWAPAVRIVGIVLLIAFVVGTWWFVIRYAYKYRPWRSAESEMGVHLLSFSATLGLLGMFYTTRILWPGLPGTMWITLALLALLVFVTWWRVTLLERTIDQDKRRGTR